MPTELITKDVWRRLSEAAAKSKKPSDVAVAYFSSGASQMLRLRVGSRLVVDASEPVVKNGLTNPAELLKMHRRGVKVFSSTNLHAKVYAFDAAAFIGSANVSGRSEATLQEAVVRTHDAKTIRATRSFVGDLCLEPLGPAELTRLKTLYRPPRFVPGGRAGLTPTKSSSLYLAKISLMDWTEDQDRAADAGQVLAEREKRHRTFVVDRIYWWGRMPFKKGQLLVEIVKDGRGRRVSPPGHVIRIQPYREGNRRGNFVYIEQPDEEWRAFSGFRKDLQDLLSRGGLKSGESTRKILAAWSPRKLRLWRSLDAQ
jgi:PLD-like domain